MHASFPIIYLAHVKKSQNTLENSLGTCPTTLLSTFSIAKQLSMSVSGFLVNQKHFAESWSPYLLEDMMGTDYTFLEEDGVFGYFANTSHLATLSIFKTTTKIAVSARILQCHVLGVASMTAPLIAHILY